MCPGCSLNVFVVITDGSVCGSGTEVLFHQTIKNVFSIEDVVTGKLVVGVMPLVANMSARMRSLR